MKLTREENDLLCRVEGDAPMGGIMRRHWLPVCLSDEVAEKDGAPVRSRLLGEDLVVFRDTNGKLGVLSEYCLHRRASLFFGRNEDCGLRCLYHGWKFDVDGNVVDMPSEAPGGRASHASKTMHTLRTNRRPSGVSAMPSASRRTTPSDAMGSRASASRDHDVRHAGPSTSGPARPLHMRAWITPLRRVSSAVRR